MPGSVVTTSTRPSGLAVAALTSVRMPAESRNVQPESSMTTGAVGGASAIASSRRGALARSSSPETYSTAAPAGVVSSRTSKSLDVVTPVECRRCRSTQLPARRDSW